MDFDRQRQTAKQCFIKYFGKENIGLKDISGGTLGITFLCDGLKQSQIFVKTHLLDIVYKNALSKEYQMLKSIYNKKIYLEYLNVPAENNTELMFLLMDYFQPGCGMLKTDIIEIIEIIRQFNKDKTIQIDSGGVYV